ncbi:helicase-exonuclease AddAB, AddA subunit [Enterococcus sp. 8G7_MSG3316]|uniref:ATP-dependent helicase/nuclease subunit A n=1 Tax=Candidatus Enterococcus testudinis TaxID=1834191 RepID=A0A242A7G6_9ENTE|nr:helicase-exonuclease AddAB subunit AddA [Enterococcus sp. 8G7_MSG3316]OTN76553.1 helicase-exonuclease AddAB, AddA subunit [Enterococcus sp. 8G7_MSG3316]
MSKIPLKPQNETFTDTQWQAIFDHGDNLLVSASAGSGKTTVLVRRVIEKLKAGTTVDALLIVTFTEAAAREMKERIEQALHEAINQESDPERRQHFVRQLQLLPTANISTLHAFCLTVIRRFYYLIDLDPNFRMLTDETETLLMKEEIWTQLRDQQYEENDEAFFKLTENFASDRSDEGVGDLIMSLYDFARANPDPIHWLQHLADQYLVAGTFADQPLYRSLIKPMLQDTLQTAHSLVTAAKDLADPSPEMDKAAAVLQQDLSLVEQLQAMVQADQVDGFYESIQKPNYARYPSFRKAEQKELSQEIKPLRDDAKKMVEQLKAYFPYPPADMIGLLEKSAPIVDKMAEMTAAFMAAFQERKLATGRLDFNDLEHFALQILQGSGDGNEAAVYYRDRFAEVLVDEYQDVNRLQEALLYWVRQVDSNPGNMFMVGDVKQSIYSFRLADPTLFIEKYMDFETEKGGRRIVLAENFRSRSDVLDFTNLVFQQLMDTRVGQIPYDEAAALVTGFPHFPDSDAYQTEILLYEKEQGDAPSLIDDKTEGELHITALKIRGLIDDQFMIYDKKTKENRPVTYSDIVLLTPTRKNNLVILDVFKKFGLPLAVNDAQNYFQATEIQTIVSLLQIIDNPYQDIPLVAVLRSPIVGLTEDQLAEIRMADRMGEYYAALLTYHQEHLQEETVLAQRVRDFLTALAQWREDARRSTIPDLLWRIYQETAYLDYVVGLPAGQQRYANLVALIHRAEKYEKSSFRGLYQFIRFVEKMQEKNKDLAEPLATPVENAVRVMTVHASKGLEFPVVFLLDTTKFFNYQDFQKRYIFEESLGAGIQYIDAAENIKYETLPFQAIKQVRLKKALSEEMRKLYVALTRAEQKLYLVGSYKNQEEGFKAWQAGLTQKDLVLDPALRLVARGSLMDWIGRTLMRHPDMEAVFPEATDRKRTIHHPAHFSITWWNQEALSVESAPLEVTEETEVESSNDVALDDLTKRLAYQYMYPKATETTSYQSVSELKRLYNDPDDQQTTLLAWQSASEKTQQQHRYVQDTLATPKFMQDIEPQAATIGTATHTVLQMLPLGETPTRESLTGLIDQLVENRFFSEEIAKQIDRESILWFYHTELGEKVLQYSNRVKREQPFSMLKEADTIFEGFDEPDAQLLIHGIIDGYIELPDEIILYDFKTDDTFGNEEQMIQKMKDRYYGQLKLYSQALEKALHKPVRQTFLVLLRAQKVLDFS